MSFFAASCNFETKLVLAFLDAKIGLNPAKLNQILAFYENPEVAIEDNFGLLRQKKPKWLTKWISNVNLQSEIDKIQTKLDKEKIEIVSSLCDNYPNTLRVLEDYPTVLYYQGNLDLVQNSQMLTVVGSRSFTKYAEILLQKILEPVCALGVGVVSGLAFGTDAASHQIALNKNAPNIGVIGSGLDEKSFYPKANWNLKKQILNQEKLGIQNGLVLSQYAPGVSANIYTFPQRNRLLAALTDLTWVVEAGQKSGSLITALKARDLGKTVATTPGSVLEESLAGNIQLLKDGASIIAQSEDILTLLGLKSFPQIIPKETVQFGSPEEEKIYQNLTLEPQETLILAQKMAMNMGELSGHLTMLEISGLAVNLGENNWIRGG